MALPATSASDRHWFRALLWIALLVQAIAAMWVARPWLTADSEIYLQLASGLDEIGFGRIDASGFQPDALRPPGYPLILNLLMEQLGLPVIGVVALQLGIYLLSIWLIERFLRRRELPSGPFLALAADLSIWCDLQCLCDERGLGPAGPHHRRAFDVAPGNVGHVSVHRGWDRGAGCADPKRHAAATGHDWRNSSLARPAFATSGGRPGRGANPRRQPGPCALRRLEFWAFREGFSDTRRCCGRKQSLSRDVATQPAAGNWTLCMMAPRRIG